MKKTVSILLPLHNEGRIIEGALKNLETLIDDATEVIAGLDGCTDATADIVREHPGVKIVEFAERLGKHEVINGLMKIAEGDIIIVHDADWLLVSDGGIETIRQLFQDSSVGGVSVPIGGMPLDTAALGRATLAFKGENIVAHYLTEYQFRRCVTRNEGRVYVNDNVLCHPFMVTIYRKDAVGDMLTTADDMERALILHRKGFRVRVIDFSDHRVYFKVCDVDKTFKVLFSRNLRSYISINRVREIYSFSVPIRYYWSATAYVFYKILLEHPVDIMTVGLWYFVTTCACLVAKVMGFKKYNAQRLWQYRADRGSG